jgi:hypothetical protein
MSIATLKKKAQAKYNNVSVNSSAGFSLNGTFRNQGYVGQTSLSRSLPRTPMKGPTPRGHGGCCGTYYVSSIIQSGVKSLEDNKVVKGSVITSRGMLAERLCENPCNIVKPDTNQNTNTQGSVVDRKRKNATACIVSIPNTSCSTCPQQSIFGRLKQPLYTKPLETYAPISQGQYIANIGEQCVNLDPITVNAAINHTPFGC